MKNSLVPLNRVRERKSAVYYQQTHTQTDASDGISNMVFPVEIIAQLYVYPPSLSPSLLPPSLSPSLPPSLSPSLRPSLPSPPSALEELGLQDVDSVVVAFPPSPHSPETMAAMKEVWKVRIPHKPIFTRLIYIHGWWSSVFWSEASHYIAVFFPTTFATSTTHNVLIKMYNSRIIHPSLAV